MTTLTHTPPLRLRIWSLVGLTIVTLFLLFPPLLPLGFFRIIAVAVLCVGLSYLEQPGAGLRSLGLFRQPLPPRVWAVYLPLAAIGLAVLYIWGMVPLAQHITGQPINLSLLESVKGSPIALLVALPIVWISAALCEEIIFRGYLITRLQTLFGSHTATVVASLLLTSLLFGYAHGSQGLAGQLVTGTLGLFLGIAFHLRRYHLGFSILLHGVFDTLIIVFYFFGGTV